jgi:Iron/zinc purple acid phosphatase-like protein C
VAATCSWQVTTTPTSTSYLQTYQGVRSFTAGTRQVIIGTGGRPLLAFRGTVQPNSLFRDARHYGYLRLTLTGTGITTAFISGTGALIDRHSFGCRTQTRG